MAGARDYNPPPSFLSSPSPFNRQIHSREQAADSWLKSTSAKQRAIAQDFKSEMKWLSSSEAKQRGVTARVQAVSDFKKAFSKC